MVFETQLLPELLGGGGLRDVSLSFRAPDGGSIPVMVSAMRDRIAPDRIRWVILEAPRRAEFERELFETRRRLADTAHALAEANRRLQERQAIIERQARALEELNRNLKREAMLDPLTRLPNRRGFLGALTEHDLLRERRFGAVLVLDIDRFKMINDTHGHAFGDLVLCSVAAVLSNACRKHDVLARFGGEEFVAWLPEADVGVATLVAERMRKAVEEMRLPDKPAFRVTISIGVALLIDCGGPGEDMVAKAIERADEAVYAAKAAGRNRVVFEGGSGSSR